MYREPIEFTVPWKELSQSLWPTTFDTIFILPTPNEIKTAPQYGVFLWVDDPEDNVLCLGQFWIKEYARIFAKAFAKRQNDDGW